MIDVLTLIVSSDNNVIFEIKFLNSTLYKIPRSLLTQFKIKHPLPEQTQDSRLFTQLLFSTSISNLVYDTDVGLFF